ncbi:hypothetical protein [Sulfuricystis multivorans]|uniref:hypothetical protein n=1 Tax=Sulfuricystis multivorans TaxID=2211108 RepID=UPI000F8348B0|nr:hypothetical protein [Sulfuricystis multivorans]
MKTTLELPDDLYRQVKATAALKGQSVKDWLTNLLQREVGAGASAIKDMDETSRRKEAEAFVAELERLAAEVAPRWQGPQDAVAALREARRDFD